MNEAGLLKITIVIYRYFSCIEVVLFIGTRDLQV
jgi:hypothetical protein